MLETDLLRSGRRRARPAVLGFPATAHMSPGGPAHPMAGVFATSWVTEAPRVRAIEADWAERMRACVLYRYDVDGGVVAPWIDGSGKRVSGQGGAQTAVERIGVEPVGGLFGFRAEAGIELRLVLNLWPLPTLPRTVRIRRVA